ncbi:MAG: ECF transporter S component, partial [Candidatus Bathyarchaeia archaeon]
VYLYRMREIVEIIIASGLVCLASMLFVTSFTSMGLFTFGEPLFFISCLLLGPYSSAFIGGVGFSLASFLLGYPHYVLASLMIKSAAGFVVSTLSKRIKNRFVDITSSLILAILFGLVGAFKFSGEIYFGYTTAFFLGERVLEHNGLWAQKVYLPDVAWFLMSLALISAIILSEYKGVRGNKWFGASLLSGCILIVLSYLLYEVFIMPTVFNVTVDAISNVSVNAGQSILAATIAMVVGKLIRLSETIYKPFF